MNSETATPASSKVIEVGVDTRSRDAFELLQLGEAVFQLQQEQRKMRFGTEEMRFERDRYKASAEAFQGKLAEALAENSRLRDLREAIGSLAAHGGEANERERLTEALHHSQAQLHALQHDHARLVEAFESSQARAAKDQYILLEITQDLIAELNRTQGKQAHEGMKVMELSREEVIWIYKVFLGREPESEDVIDFRVNSGISRRDMIMQIIDSEEFAAKHTIE